MNKVFICFGLLALYCAALFGQSSSASFEVASIKPSDPDTRGVTFQNGPGSVHIIGATVSLLIQQAYDVRNFQIEGGPGWINSERYDVMAKVARPAHPSAPGSPIDMPKMMEQRRERLQTLLAERCRLKIRRETKNMPVYVLVLGKGGSKLKESGTNGAETAPDGEKSPQPSTGPRIRVGRGQIIGQSITLDFLAQMLSRQLGRPVLDKTGLKGVYDFTLEWTPDPAPSLGPGFGDQTGSIIAREPPRLDSSAPAEASGPSLFAAIQEQLGLKLESEKAPTGIIVIENVEKPSEN